MTGWMWLLPTVIGIVALGVAHFYGRRKTQELYSHPDAVRKSEQATRTFYEREERNRNDPL